MREMFGELADRSGQLLARKSAEAAG